eukprot:jgi/Undpi1/5636/HiC_scaffold_2.g00911.m1
MVGSAAGRAVNAETLVVEGAAVAAVAAGVVVPASGGVGVGGSSSSPFCPFPVLHGNTYIHKGSVIICGLDGNHTKTLKNGVGARAAQVLSPDGQRMIYFFDVKGGRSSSAGDDIGHVGQLGTQGIAMVPKGRLFIVGCTDGDVFAFEAKCGPKGEACELYATLKGHQHPVTCAAADTEWLASGDASGTIITWSAKGSLARECSFVGDGNPATSLCARGDQVIASFSTGHVRIFDIGKK